MAPFDMANYSLFALVFVYLTVIVVVTHRLKNRYPDAWDQIGRFTLFANNSPSGSWAFFKFFVLSNDYRRLGDKPLNAMALFIRVVVAIFTVIFALNIFLVMTS
jgi:hypothetical protein